MTSSVGDGRGFKRNVLSNWAAFVFSAVVSFFLSPFVVRSLGPESYGLWVLLGSLVGYLGLLLWGSRRAVTRFVAKHYAENRARHSSAAVSSGIVLFGGLGVLAVLVATVMALIAPLAFEVPQELKGQVRVGVLIGGVNIAVALIGGVFGGVVAARQRFDISSGIEIVVTGIRSIAVVVALSNGYGLVALAVIQLVWSVMTVCANWSPFADCIRS